MSKPRLRALILSAGFGTRLRPLTFDLPKPLLPIGGEPAAGWTLRRLQAAGCEAAALNLHSLPDSIRSFFGSSYFGLPLTYSHEPEIQGTYGALYPLRDFLRDADAVVMVNGDSLCDWPVRQVVEHHLKEAAEATLLLLERPPDSALGGGIAIDAEGRVVQMRGYEPAPGGRRVASRHVFSGLHVLSPSVFDVIDERAGDILELLYQPLLSEGGRLASLVTGRRWHDLGTPGRYYAAALEEAALHGSLGRRLWRRIARPRRLAPPLPPISALAAIDPTARVHRSQVARGSVIGGSAEISASLILWEARLGEGCRVRGSIVGPGVVLPPGSEVIQRMICRHDPRHVLNDSESLIADLVYTPL